MRRGLVADTRAIRLLEAQIATGGLIDPRANHRVPLNVAYRRGLFNEETNRRLEDPTDDTKGFFDPNTQENLTYLDLIRRCQKEPETGFHFLVLRERRRREGRASRTSLWHSDSRSTNSLHQDSRSTTNLQTSNSLSMTNLHEEGSSSRISQRNYNQSNARSKTPDSVTRSTSRQSQIVEDEKTGKKYRETEEVTTETRTRELTRKEILFTTPTGVVNLHDLIESKCVDHQTIKDLEKGKISLDQARSMMDQYLNGYPPIAGVMIQHGGNIEEIISIYDAELRGLVDPTLSLYLLEAQAATGGLCHPNDAKRYDLLSGFEHGLIDRETIPELKNGLSAVLGFVSKGRSVVTPMDAFRHGMISEDDVKRLLHVQVATGGIVNVHKAHRLPLPVAHDRCMWQNEWISDVPKVYHFNGVNYSYQELMARACKPHPTNSRPLLKVKGNPSKVCAGVRSVMDIPLKYYRECQLISELTHEAAQLGYITEVDVENQLRRRLIGCEPISGVSVEGQKLSIWDAVRSGLLKPGNAVELMEAQVAATGALIDVNSGKLRIDVARETGCIDYALADTLNRAAIAHNGGDKRIPIAVQIAKGTIADSKGTRLLEVQLACGGVVEPETALHFPVKAAIERGLIESDQIRQIRKNKFFYDPERDERLSYLELCLRCIKDETGRLSLPINLRGMSKSKKNKNRRRRIVIVDPETNEEMTSQIAFDRGLIDKATFRDLLQQEGKSNEYINEVVEGKTHTRIPVHHERELGCQIVKYKYF